MTRGAGHSPSLVADFKWRRGMEREERKDADKRARLFEAAAEEFLRQGAESASFEEIARSAGLTKEEARYGFENREVFRREVLKEVCTRLREALGAFPVPETPGELREQMDECRARISRFFERRPASALLALQALDETDDATVFAAESLKTEMKKLLLQGQKLGLVRKELSADLLVQVICSYTKALSRVVAWQQGSPSRMSPSRARGLVRTVFDMNLRILRPERGTGL